MPPARIAVFNDTSSHRHFGCDAVMDAIDRTVSSRGGSVIHRQAVGAPWRDDDAAVRAIAEADVVIVNGEGSIHHSSAIAADLAALGPFCRSLRKPCYLINALVQANNGGIMENLAAFTGAWTRDRRSADELRKHGIRAEFCGDLSFLHDVPLHNGTRRHGITIDSADHRVDMRTTAMALGTGLISIRHRKSGLKTYRRNWRRRFEPGKPTGVVGGITTFRRFAEHLASYRFIVTGRFHGLCFALNCGVPVAAISLSNWKSEALLEDVGLGTRRLYRPGEIPAPFSADELAAIASYKAATKTAIGAMFDAIMTR